MDLQEILVTTIDRLKDKIENTVNGNNYWWSIGIGMLVAGIIITVILIVIAFSNLSYNSGSFLLYFILGVICGVLIGGGIDKMVSAGTSNSLLIEIKKEMEGIKNSILANINKR